MSMSHSGGQRSNDGAHAGETDITRRSAIRRAGRVASGLAVFPGLPAACGSDDKASSTGAGGTSSTAATEPAPLTKNGTTRASFKPYDKNVPPGPATPLPKKVATNFPAGSAYFDDFSKNVEKAVTDRGFKFSSTQWET